MHSCNPEKRGGRRGGSARWVCLYKKSWLNWPNQHIHLLLGARSSRGCYGDFLPWVLGLSEESQEALCGERLDLGPRCLLVRVTRDPARDDGAPSRWLSPAPSLVPCYSLHTTTLDTRPRGRSTCISDYCGQHSALEGVLPQMAGERRGPEETRAFPSNLSLTGWLNTKPVL